MKAKDITSSTLFNEINTLKDVDETLFLEPLT